MPLPLQQRWDSFENYQIDIKSKGITAGPNYYIGPKADLYYYSFIDAMYAKQYLALSKDDQFKLDLMITGFNPMDVYAAQHIKRAVLTYPGAFDGIGEFTIHKEIVSDKLAGDAITDTKAPTVALPPDVYSQSDTVSLYADSLTRLLKEAGDIGLVAMLHNDIYLVEVSHDGELKARHPDKSYEKGLIDLCSRVKGTKIIWAHTGLGRFVEPQSDHLQIVSRILDACPDWYTDISWDLVQDYILDPKPGMPSTEEWREFLNKYHDRVLWGSDDVIYSRNKFDFDKKEVELGSLMTPSQYDNDVHRMDKFKSTLKFSESLDYDNYRAIFTQAREKVRGWESEHANDNVWDLTTPITK